MKLACQESLVPGASLKEKCENLLSYGYEGIEFGGRGLKERVPEVLKALEATGMKASTICSGYGGALLANDPARRREAVEGIKELFKVASDIGAVGVIAVPIFGGPELPDVSPLMSVVELEKQLLVKLCEELAPAAEENGVCLLLEPLNRYETHLLKTVADAAEIAKQVNRPGIRIMADFFHMSIEERNIPQALQEAGDLLRHIHLAESTRLLPNPEYGHTDFKAGFAALKQMGYTGYMALECGVPGDAATELKRTAEYLKACIS